MTKRHCEGSIVIIAPCEMPQAGPLGAYSLDFHFWKQIQDTTIDSFPEFRLLTVTDLLKGTEKLRLTLVTKI